MCFSRTVLAVLAGGALVLGACGQLPRPFAPESKDASPDLVRPADGAGVVVDASGCAGAAAATLGDAVVEALRRHEVPAATTGGNRGSLRLACDESAGGDGAVLRWALTGADGSNLGGFEQPVTDPDLGAAGASALERLADDAAMRVLALLDRDAPLPPSARRPALVVTPVVGAPGNGEVALTRAMAVALEWQGAALALEPDGHALLVLGSVAVSDAEPGVELVEVVWEVLKPDGERLGVVSQKNTVPRGALDGEWGALAAAIAAGGAEGVIDLLRFAIH